MKITKIIRVLLGVMFLMTGMMKIALPFFGNAFLIQLTEAHIPLAEIGFWAVPIVEVGIGIMLLLNYRATLAMLLIVPIMAVAIYVHFVVLNPEAFPAQPQFPIIPILVLAMVAVNLGATISLTKKNNG